MAEARREGVCREAVVRHFLSLAGPIAFDLDAVGLAADRGGQLAQSGAGAAAGVEQLDDSTRRRACGPD